MQVVDGIPPPEAHVEMARHRRVESGLGDGDEDKHALVVVLVHCRVEDEAVGRGVGVRAVNQGVEVVAQVGAETDGKEEPERGFRAGERGDRVRDGVCGFEGDVGAGGQRAAPALALETGLGVFGGAAEAWRAERRGERRRSSSTG